MTAADLPPDYDLQILSAWIARVTDSDEERRVVASALGLPEREANMALNFAPAPPPILPPDPVPVARAHVKSMRAWCDAADTDTDPTPLSVRRDQLNRAETDLAHLEDT